MSQVWTLWTLGSKGQRSRSQCKDYWKRFLAHNCFPFTPIFMKLHIRSPHESSMDPIDFRVKRSKVKVINARITEKGVWRITASPILCITWRVWIGCRGGYFVPLGQPHSSLKLDDLLFQYLLSAYLQQYVHNKIQNPPSYFRRRRGILCCTCQYVSQLVSRSPTPFATYI